MDSNNLSHLDEQIYGVNGTDSFDEELLFQQQEEEEEEEENYYDYDDNDDYDDYDDYLDEKDINMNTSNVYPNYSQSYNLDDYDSDSNSNSNRLQVYDSNDMTEWTKTYPIVNNDILFESFTPIDLYNLHFTEDFWNLLVFNTNLYADQYLNSKSNYLKTHKASRAKGWKPTDVAEMKVYFAITIYMGIVKLSDLCDHWSTNALLNTCISKYMSRSRYQIISTFLHLNDNLSNLNKNDRLHKVRPLLDYCENIFRLFCIPGIFLTVDEDLIPFHGRIGFKQYIKNKPNRWGIKIYKICCSKTSYCFNFDIYSGKKPSFSKTLFTATSELVINLSKEYLNTGRHIFTDNYFTSKELAIYLASQKTGLTGTIRANRIKNKNLLLNIKALKKIGVDIKNYGCLRLLQFYDKRDVRILTTSHLFKESDFYMNSNLIKTDSIQHDKFAEKKIILKNYNKLSNGVDMSNQMTKSYRNKHKCIKWWRPIYLYLVDMLIQNSYVIYKIRNGKLSSKEYRLNLIEYLLNKKPDHSASTNFHLVEYIDEDSEALKRKRRKCRVCSKKTVWKCGSCSVNNRIVALCIPLCFSEYHTANKFNRNIMK